MLTIFRHKGKLTFLGKSSEFFSRKYRIKDIALIKCSFSDSTHPYLSIRLYIKDELKKLPPDFYILSPELQNEQVCKIDSYIGSPDYKRVIEINEETEENILKIIMELTQLCNAYKICLIQPEQSEMMFSKYIEWYKQKDALTWWKEDLVSRTFSKN